MSDKIITWHQFQDDCKYRRYEDGKVRCIKSIHNEKCKKHLPICGWNGLRIAPTKEHTKWILAFLAGLLVMGFVWIGVVQGAGTAFGAAGYVCAGFVLFIIAVALGVPS